MYRQMIDEVDYFNIYCEISIACDRNCGKFHVQRNYVKIIDSIESCFTDKNIFSNSIEYDTKFKQNKNG